MTDFKDTLYNMCSGFRLRFFLDSGDKSLYIEFLVEFRGKELMGHDGKNCSLERIVAFWNLGRIVGCDELSVGTNCRLGRIVGLDELSVGTNCRLGRIVGLDELSVGTNCQLGRIVGWDESSVGTNCRLGGIVSWDESSVGTNCRLGGIVG